MTPVLVLVGPPGAGKSSVGRRVAAALGVGFRDTDADVAEAAGKSIADIFLTDGEPAFRAMETSAVATALVEHTGVLALGGGAVLDEDTQAALSDLRPRRVVFLDVNLADASRRVGLNRDRPLLVGNPRSRLKRLMDERRGLYEALSGAVVDTSGRAVHEVVDAVLAALAEWSGEQP